MAAPSSSSTSGYRPAPLASLPRELDPAEYNESLEKRRAEAERLALRARLKRQYQLQLNDPHRVELIVSPAAPRRAPATGPSAGGGSRSPEPRGSSLRSSGLPAGARRDGTRRGAAARPLPATALPH